VDFQVTLWKAVNGHYEKEHVGGLHPCTDQDYQKFYPRAYSADKTFEHFKKKKAMMCLNDLDYEGQKISKNIYVSLAQATQEPSM